MLIMSGVMKLIKPAQLVEEFIRLGYQEHQVLVLGIVELACTAIYLVPSTSVLGAILLTGYLGGATATHVRLGENFVFPVIFGVLVWLGLLLPRAPALAALTTASLPCGTGGIELKGRFPRNSNGAGVWRSGSHAAQPAGTWDRMNGRINLPGGSESRRGGGRGAMFVSAPSRCRWRRSGRRRSG